MVKALLALTSYDGKFYEDGLNTGVYFVEAYHPWLGLDKAGVEVTLVSEKGTFGWDAHSITEEALTGDDRKVYEDANSKFMKATKDVKKASDVDPSEYQIFFAAGGHGAAFDYPYAKDLQKLLLSVSEQGGAIGAVCHGPCIFENLKDSEGAYFASGKNITGFTDDGEKAVGVDSIMKRDGVKTPRQGADSIGANYVQPPDLWGSFTVVDGNIVTGVNPASATETVEKTIALVQ